jgi:hypothetical protein
MIKVDLFNYKTPFDYMGKKWAEELTEDFVISHLDIILDFIDRLNDDYINIVETVEKLIASNNKSIICDWCEKNTRPVYMIKRMYNLFNDYHNGSEGCSINLDIVNMFKRLELLVIPYDIINDSYYLQVEVSKAYNMYSTDMCVKDIMDKLYKNGEMDRDVLYSKLKDKWYISNIDKALGKLLRESKFIASIDNKLWVSYIGYNIYEAILLKNKSAL